MARKKSPVERVKSSLYLPKPLHEQLSKLAEETGVSVNDIMIMAARQFLNSPPPTVAMPAPPADDDIAGFN